MRVLITGGTGLIGRALSADLVADGHEVIVLSRSPGQVADLSEGVRVEGWDAETAEGWAHLADGADAIVNLAGANLAGEGFFPSRWTDERKALIRDSRLNAGRAVVEAVGRRPDGVLYIRHSDRWVRQAARRARLRGAGRRAASGTESPGGGGQSRHPGGRGCEQGRSQSRWERRHPGGRGCQQECSWSQD